LQSPASRIGAGLLAIGVGLVALQASEVEPGFSYLSGSAGSAILGLAAGWALVVAGLETCRRARQPWLGALLVGAGIAWLLPDWSDPTVGVDAAFTLGLGFAWLYLPLVGHTLLSVEGAMRAGWRRAALIAAGYGIAILGLGLIPAMAFDPQASGCGFCPANLIDTVSAPALADGVARVSAALAMTWGLTVVVVLGLGMRHASDRVRRSGIPILAPGIVFLILASLALGRSVIAAVATTDPVDQLLRLGQAAALVAVAAGIGWEWVRGRRARSRVARMVADLARSPQVGGLRERLATLLRDPELRIAYPVAGPQMVDASGRPTLLQPAAGRETTPIVRDGTVVAIVEHDAEVLRSPSEIEEVIAAARLGLEHERLQAESRAQLDALRAARRRIVVAGDARRRQLERDLHDGAQQLLIAVSIGLRLIDRGTDIDPRIEAASRELTLAIDDLRRIAHGIYPAVLGDEGFGAAVDALAESSPARVTISGMIEDRFDPMVEAAAYHVVAEVLRAGRGPVRIRVSREDRTLGVRMSLAALPELVDVDLADRVGAVDGSIDIVRHDGRVDLWAELPCGS
jgi:signal transduction histidine kinase